MIAVIPRSRRLTADGFAGRVIRAGDCDSRDEDQCPGCHVTQSLKEISSVHEDSKGTLALEQKVDCSVQCLCTWRRLPGYRLFRVFRVFRGSNQPT